MSRRRQTTKPFIRIVGKFKNRMSDRNCIGLICKGTGKYFREQLAEIEI
jgi:hypothetical protein